MLWPVAARLTVPFPASTGMASAEPCPGNAWPVQANAETAVLAKH